MSRLITLLTPEPLGPLIDAAPQLMPLIEQPNAGTGNLRQLLSALAEQPRVLLMDDVHWADAATLDFLLYTSRRVESLPLLVVATYRNDEVAAYSPLAAALGDLSTRSAVVHVTLPPLSAAGVTRLAQACSPDRTDSKWLYRVTGGNPFLLCELLATGTQSADDGVPVRVRGLLLGRISRLSPEARHVLNVAAVLGPADAPALQATADVEPSAIDECTARGFLRLVPEGSAAVYRFRHELTRQTVSDYLSAEQRIAVHRAALDWLRTQPVDHRRLAYHAAGCADAETVLEHAPRAAERARLLNAHREAAALYELALRAGGPLTDAQRGELLDECAQEYFTLGDIEHAIALRTEALHCHQMTGDVVAASLSLQAMSRAAAFALQTTTLQAVGFAEEAVRLLEELPPGPALATAYGTLASMWLGRNELDTAVGLINKALAILGPDGDPAARSMLIGQMGVAMQHRAGPGGEPYLLESLAIAERNGLLQQAARCYANLAPAAWIDGRTAEAATYARRGLDFCKRHRLPAWEGPLHTVLGTVLADQGLYDKALEHLHTVLDRVSSLTAISTPAKTAAGLIAVRRGHGPVQLLAEARTDAPDNGDARWSWCIARAEAEAAWITGNPQQIPGLLKHALAGAERAWVRGELAWWMHVANAETALASDVPEPFALMLAGEWREAARHWEAKGWRVWQAIALANSPVVTDAKDALAILDEVGALAVRAAVLRDRQAAGLDLPRPARGARASASLTGRQLEVLRLIAQGKSNAAIADVLYLSERTVEHHVTAIMRELAAPNRTAAVHAAQQRGLL